MAGGANVTTTNPASTDTGARPLDNHQQPAQHKLHPCVRYLFGFAWLFVEVSPSFDDIEKALQIYGILMGLMLSCVSGFLSEEFAVLERGDRILNLIWASFELLVIALVMDMIVYLHLVFIIDQDDLRRLKLWWRTGGRVSLASMTLLFLVGAYQYIQAVTMTFEDRYPKDFKYGILYHWTSIVWILLVMLIGVHLSWLPIVQDLQKTQPS
mmetsp:Transcript_1382/g.5127  ORF Transcript_1382/g.5127 Transcript_1382/m.5127 type:complete len:211 (+) Transcript_1382:153-785(+)